MINKVNILQTFGIGGVVINLQIYISAVSVQCLQ